jgi:hypothetical protein
MNGLCTASGVVKTTEHNILETGSVSVLRWEDTPTLFDSLERANLNHCTTYVQVRLILRQTVSSSWCRAPLDFNFSCLTITFFLLLF